MATREEAAQSLLDAIDALAKNAADTEQPEGMIEVSATAAKALSEAWEIVRPHVRSGVTGRGA